MKVTVFGATGGVGKQVVDQALAAGHEVTAVARRPEDVTAEHDRLTVVPGDVFDPESVERAVSGSDAVVSALGVKDRKKPTTLFSDGVKNELESMRSTGVRRIIALSADGVEDNPNVNIGQRLVTKLVVSRIFKHPWNDMRRMEHELAGSDADWTVIRPPRLNDGEHTGKYRSTSDGLIKDPSSISRADLADYIVAHLDDRSSYQKKVGVSY